MRRAVPSLTRLARDEGGSTAAEFGLICLVFISMILGVIDMGRLAWRINAAKAATREAARYAVVNPMISTYMANYNGLSQNIPGGQVVPNMAFRCSGASSSCTQIVGSGGNPGFNATVFNAMLAKMQGLDPEIQAANVVVTYRHVGLGVVGDPYGPDMEPLVTVSLTGVTFQSAALQIFGVAPFTLPDMASTLSGESLS
ncbi:TadE/TadG family type IV pilus assembly protein [Caulobacter sp. LARHSG274]